MPRRWRFSKKTAGSRSRDPSTRLTLQQQSQRNWICSACLLWINHKPTWKRVRGKWYCPHCQGLIHHFPSGREGQRYAILRQKEQYGLISGLLVHPRFPVVINGIDVFFYEADFLYFSDHSLVVEDVKATSNPKGWDPVFKLKKRCVEAAHGITVRIVT